MTTLEKYNSIKTAYLVSLKTIQKSENTYIKYGNVLNDFEKCLNEFFADEQNLEITPQIILKYSEMSKNRGISNNTLRNYLTILKTFFTWCNEHKFYSEQPIIKQDMPKKDRIEYDLLTQDEINLILSGEIPKYTKHPNRNRAIVFLLLLTGLRVSELINLRYEDIDLKNESITIVGKGDKKRTTSLPKLAVKMLNLHINQGFINKNKSDFVFCNDEGQPFTRFNISNIIERYVEKLTGHKHIKAHDLRHAFASMLITNNVSIPTISATLGHSNWETTAIYASHLCPQKQVIEVNNIFNNLFTI